MQTRKRAKPVKFGKAAAAKKEKEEPKGKEVKAVDEPVKKEPEAKPEETSVSEPIITPEGKDSQGEITQSTAIPVEPTAAIHQPEGVSAPETTTEVNPPEEQKPVESTPAQPPATDAPVIENNSGVSVPVEPATPATDQSSVTPPAAEEEKEEENGQPEEKQDVDEQWPLAPKGEKKHNMLVYFFVVAIVAFLIGISFIAGVYYATHGKGFSLPSLSIGIPGTHKSVPTPRPTVATTPTTAPTSSVSANLSQYTISVLNGSGIVGEAARVKDALTSAGFKVTNVGNADSSSFTKTQISAKKSVDAAYIEKLKETLQKTYVVEVESQVPDSSQTTDVVVTIGSSTASK